MTFFRYAQDVYGQETLLGASWDLIGWFAAAGAAFIVLHIIYKLIAGDEKRATPAPYMGDAAARVVRHRLVDRIYHWFMAASVIVLLITAFGPHLGWRFNWLTTHWIAGVVLGFLVAYHIVRAVVWQDLWTMLPSRADLRNVWNRATAMVSPPSAPPGLPGKYELLQKLYHWAIAAIVLLLVATGAAMLSKIDTPLWRRNPYWLSQKTWGYIYATHDLCAMGVLMLVMIHIYFGLRPGKLWMLRSMTLGWITRRDYLSNHDPREWDAPEAVRRSDRNSTNSGNFVSKA